VRTRTVPPRTVAAGLALSGPVSAIMQTLATPISAHFLRLLYTKAAGST
jgi:hypothetical protein